MSAQPMSVLPGWWGKLPGTGDFSHRRLPDAVRVRLDDWLQIELGALRLRHAAWQTAYLAAPLWHFVAGVGLLSDASWLGVMMPSVDRVGRYFPLVIMQTSSQVSLAGGAPQGWWRRVTAAALQSLREDRDPQGLDDALAVQFAQSGPADLPDDGFREIEAGSSLWRSSAGSAPPLVCTGWPRDAHFDLLFDLAGLPANAGPVT